MSYDIPDEIKYREKIVFGLDFKQLGYAIAVGVLAVLAYGLPLEGQGKLVLPATIAVIGAGFIFLNLEERALDAYHYFRGVRKASSVDPAAQRLVGVTKIENNAVFLADKGLRAVLRVEPLNFTLLDEVQRKAVILAYREFLNHLTAPVQIVVKTCKPNLEGYFTRAQARLNDSNSEMNALFEDFMVYEQGFLKDNNVRERRFYLVVTHDTNGFIAKATTNSGQRLKELAERTKIIQEKLLACGLRSRRLGNKGLAAFLSSYSSQEAEASEDSDNEETKNEENQSQKAQNQAENPEDRAGSPENDKQTGKTR